MTRSAILAQVGQGLALGPDAVEHVALAGERMAAARLAVAPHQRLVARLEEQHLGRWPRVAQLCQRVEQVREVLALADVDPSAIGRMSRLERAKSSAKVGMSVVGRLSTQKKPMSSKHLIA